MPKISLSIAHALPPAEACARLKNLLNEVKAQNADKISDLHEEWDGHSGKFRLLAAGFRVSGAVIVKESQVDITGDLPFAAILFKGRIESAIRERAKTLLA
jgi:hypothetical protein